MKRFVHAVCPHECPDDGGVLITVDDRRAKKIQGSAKHPVTRGAKMTLGFQSIDALTSEKLASLGNSATVYSVLVEVELSKPAS